MYTANTTPTIPDQVEEQDAPKWTAKAKGTIPWFDSNGNHIPMSAFGKFVDDRNVYSVWGKQYLVRCKADVAYYENNIRAAGFAL